MPFQVRPLLIAMLALVPLIAFASQDQSQAIRGKPIVAVKGVLAAHYVGRRTRDGKEVSQVVVSLTRTELNGFDLGDLLDGGSWWLWKGSQDSAGAVSPFPKALPDHPSKVTKTKTVDVFTLDLDPQLMGLKDGDSLLVFLVARRRGSLDTESVVLNEEGLNMTVARPPLRDSITVGGLSVSPNEQLENGSKTLVAHATLTYDRPDLHAGLGWTRLHFLSTNTLSTNSLDESAYFSGTVLAEKIRMLDGLFPSFPLSPFVRLDTSESFNNQSASVGIVGKVRLSGTRFGMGDTFDSVRDAMLYLVPIQYQDRFHRSGYIAPWDTRDDILVSSATVLWEPIYIWSPKEVPDITKDYSLHISGNLWYFPDRRSAPGIEPKWFTSRADIELQIPFVKLRLQKRIPIPLRLTVAFGTGAAPSDGYVYSTSVSLGVKATF